jgi:protein SFI1
MFLYCTHVDGAWTGLALAFSTRPSSAIALSSLQMWCRVYATHQNAAAFAVHYHSAQLSFKIMLRWRIRLRERLKMVRQAKIADKFLVLRRTWKRWKTQLEDAKRLKKVKLWDRAKLKAAFEREYLFMKVKFSPNPPLFRLA